MAIAQSIIGSEETKKRLENAKIIRDFEVFDFADSTNQAKQIENYNKLSAEDKAKKRKPELSGILEKDIIDTQYKPILAEFKKALSEVKTQEEFDNVIENFGKEKVEKLKEEVNTSLKDVKNMAENLKDKNSFSEITKEDLANNNSAIKMIVEANQKVENLINNGDIENIAYKPSTYDYVDNVGEVGSLGQGDILKKLKTTPIGEFIQNSKALDKEIVKSNVDGSLKTHNYYKNVEVVNDNGEKKNENIYVKNNHFVYIKDVAKGAVLKELNNVLQKQTKEIIDLQKEGKNPAKNKSFSNLDDVKVLLGKTAMNYVQEDNELGKELVTQFQKNIAGLMPEKVSNENFNNVKDTAKFASYNPMGYLKNEQYLDYNYTKEMVTANAGVIRSLPDKVVKYKSVSDVLNKKIDTAVKEKKDTKFLDSLKEYVEAVKDNKKDEFLAKEKAEREAKKVEKNNNATQKATNDTNKEIEENEKKQVEQEKAGANKEKLDVEIEDEYIEPADYDEVPF